MRLSVSGLTSDSAGSLREPNTRRGRTYLSDLVVGLLGTPVSSGNRGVQALATSLVNLCAASAPGAGFQFLLGHDCHEALDYLIAGRHQPAVVVPARLSPRSRPSDHLGWILTASLLYRCVPISVFRKALARLSPWIQALQGASLVGDIRGGDSFSDIYGMRRFLHGFLMAWTVVLVRGSIVQFPQTFGPYKSPFARSLARWLLRRSSVIVARDRQSQRVAQELVGNWQQVLLSPDVAFSLEGVTPERIVLDPPIPQSAFCASRSEARSAVLGLQCSVPAPGLLPIGLNVNGLMYNGGYTRKNMFGLRLDYAAFPPMLVDALLQEHPGEIWLVPHTYGPLGSVESDPEACRRVRSVLPPQLASRVRQVTGEYDCHEIKGIIGQCDFFIGSRMHACIAALSQGIPCVGIAYSMKFAGVFETVGMEDWVIDGRTTTNEAAIARVLELYRRRDSIRADLRRKADEAKARLQVVFRELFASVASDRHQHQRLSAPIGRSERIDADPH